MCYLLLELKTLQFAPGILDEKNWPENCQYHHQYHHYHDYFKNNEFFSPDVCTGLAELVRH